MFVGLPHHDLPGRLPALPHAGLCSALLFCSALLLSALLCCSALLTHAAALSCGDGMQTTEQDLSCAPRTTQDGAFGSFTIEGTKGASYKWVVSGMEAKAAALCRVRVRCLGGYGRWGRALCRVRGGGLRGCGRWGTALVSGGPGGVCGGGQEVGRVEELRHSTAKLHSIVHRMMLHQHHTTAHHTS